MEEFLLLLQAELDKASINGIKTEIKDLQDELNKIKIQPQIDPKILAGLAKQIGTAIGQNIDLSKININSDSADKVGQDIGKKISQGIGNGMKGSKALIDSFRKSLSNIGMESTEINSVIRRIQSLNVEIQSLNQSISRTSGKNGKDLLNVGVIGTDKYGNAIKMTQQFDMATWDLVKTLDGVSTAQERAGASTSNFAKQQKLAAANLTNQINQIYRAAKDPNASKPIKLDNDLNLLDSKYNEITTAIENMRNASSATFDEEQANVKRLISEYKSLVSELKNAETVATSLRSKDIDTVKSEYGSKLDVLVSRTKSSGVYDQIFGGGKEESLRNALSNADASGMINFLNDLDKLNAEYKSATEAARAFNQEQKVKINTSSLESKISAFQNVNPAINNFKTEINGVDVSIQSLLDDLSRVQTQGDLSVVNAKWKAFSDAAKSAGIEVKKDADSQKTLINDLKQSYQKIQNLEIKKAGLDTSKDVAQIAELDRQIEEARENYNNLLSDAGKKSFFDTSEWDKTKKAIDDATKSQIEFANAKKQDSITSSKNAELDKLQKLKKGWSEQGILVGEFKNRVEQLESELNTVGDSKGLSELKSRLKDISSYAKSLKIADGIKVDQTILRLNNQLRDNSRYSSEAKAQIQGWISELQKGNVAESRLKEINQQARQLHSEMQSLGKTGGGFFETLSSKLGTLSTYFSAGMVISRGLQSIRSGISSVVDLDTALVDLRKTANMTSQELEDFYYQSNNVAKQMGVSTEDILNQAAAWSRLGYNTKEQATQMAEYSAMFKMISPGMDMDSATNGLVSTMKAFKIGAEDVSEVVDGIMSKINIIGNTRALDNSDIINFLTRSSSAMAEANNSLDDTIALGTAITEVTRDAANAGQVLKTVSMRLRGYDEETEEYVGGVEELSGAIANLTKTASTPGGISLFTDESKTEYKSTLELLRDISKIYDQLSDKNQAELLETLAGKRNGQAIAAALNNWEAVEDSLKSMADSAGNAREEMSIAMDSISYKANALKETGTGIAQNLFNRENMKSVLDVLNSLASVIDTVTEKLGLFNTAAIGIGGFLGAKNLGQLNNLRKIVQGSIYAPCQC